MSVVKGIFLIICYNGFIRRNLLFKNPQFHINTIISVHGVAVALNNRAALGPSSAQHQDSLRKSEREEEVSGRKVRRWRLNGLQEEGRED